MSVSNLSDRCFALQCTRRRLVPPLTARGSTRRSQNKNRPHRQPEVGPEGFQPTLGDDRSESHEQRRSAGVILRDQGRVTGLTTAGTLWATAAVGLAIAFSMYVLGILTALIIFGLLALHHCPGWVRLKGGATHSATEQKEDAE